MVELHNLVAHACMAFLFRNIATIPVNWSILFHYITTLINTLKQHNKTISVSNFLNKNIRRALRTTFFRTAKTLAFVPYHIQTFPQSSASSRPYVIPNDWPYYKYKIRSQKYFFLHIPTTQAITDNKAGW
jgi:hypothetical protein